MSPRDVASVEGTWVDQQHKLASVVSGSFPVFGVNIHTVAIQCHDRFIEKIFRQRVLKVLLSLDYEDPGTSLFQDEDSRIVDKDACRGPHNVFCKPANLDGFETSLHDVEYYRLLVRKKSVRKAEVRCILNYRWS